MGESSISTAPFSRHGVSWREVLKLVAWLLPIATAALALYLRSEFATHATIRAAVTPFEPLPAKVQSLEEFRGRQEKAQEQTTIELRLISNAQASTNAILAEQARTTSRILDQLERMNARAVRTGN